MSSAPHGPRNAIQVGAKRLMVAGRKGDKFESGMQRDNWYASVIFEEWENGTRNHIDTLMARK